MMRKFVGILLLAPLLVLGQKPFINSISPTHIEVGQIVNISGSNLGNASSRVFFGGVEATSVTGNGNLLQAVVPAGATHGFVTVLNTVSNLIGQSSQQFYISFSGTDITTYDPEYIVPTTEQAASDICMCDLDGDGKNDLVVVHNIQSSDNSQSEFTIYRNNSTGTGAFSGSDFQLTGKINNAINQTGFISVSCRDLDNNGLPELIFTSNVGTNSRDLFVYRNQSTVGTIALNPLDLSILQLPATGGGSGRIPRTVRSADMDGDGKSDLVVGNDTDNTFHVFRNTSTPGNISFSSPSEHPIGTETTGLVEIVNIDNNGNPDVISMPFRQSSSGINISKNQSDVGDFRFILEATISNGGQTSGVSSGDFDNDGLIDLVVASRNTGRITTFRNTSTGSVVSFENGENLTTSANSSFGVDLGDMNGDGKLDIVSSYATSNVHVFENTSTSGDISFGNEQVLSTNTTTTQYVCVGDLNGDAKPDIAFTRDVQLNIEGDLGIILNRNCIVPVITPADLEFCLNDNFTLNATKSIGATYSWEITTGNGTNPVDTDADASITITSGTSATVRVTISQDGCSEEGTADFTILGGVQPSAPTFPSPSDQICVGDNYDITVLGGPFANFEWIIPDGSVVSTTTPTLSLSNATVDNAGIYKVRAQPASGCFSEESLEFSLSVSQPPLFQIFNNGGDDFCVSSSVTLEVPNFPSDFNYQWKRNGTNIGGATASSFSANQTGNYTVLITDADNCSNETSAYTVNAIPEPVSIISGSVETCQNIETTFTAASTGEAGFTLEYLWSIDGGTPFTPSTPTELTTSFSAVGAHTITLTTRYNSSEVATCSDQTTFNVTVSAEPVITFNQADVVEKCQADIITTSLSGPTAGTIASYNWTIRNADASNALISTSPITTPSFDASTPVGIDSIYAVVSIVTTIGCTVKDSIKIKNFESDADISSADFPTVLSDNIARLEDVISINLVAENVVSNFAWEPAENMDTPTASSVTFFPQGSSTIVTLTGTDIDGCLVATEVTIELDNLRPKKIFSPNGDGLNDCWEILNIGDQGEANDCKVYVFDARGSNILIQDVFDLGNCVWNGTTGGSQAPEGVYYFVLKCERDDNLSKTGSILLAR